MAHGMPRVRTRSPTEAARLAPERKVGRGNKESALSSFATEQTAPVGSPGRKKD